MSGEPGVEPFHPPQVLDERGRPLDVIALRGLTVNCIVGVYNRERVAAQPLRLDVALFLDTRSAAASGRLADTVHYARLTAELRFLLEACRFELLESAAEAVCHYLLAPALGDSSRPRLQAASVRITKPEALGGLTVPSLQVHRAASEMVYATREVSFGRVEVLHEGTGYGVYRLGLVPGGTAASPARPVSEESGLVLGIGILAQGQPVARGTAFHWPRDVAHRYDNITPSEQTVLCVARPRLELTPGEAPPVEGLTRVPGHAYYPWEDPR